MNELQKKYVGNPHYRTEKMFAEVKDQIYKKGYDVCTFEVRDNEKILVEVLCEEDETLSINIEWCKMNPYKPIETTLVNFSDDKEIFSALDYIRQCAEDGCKRDTE